MDIPAILGIGGAALTISGLVYRLGIIHGKVVNIETRIKALEDSSVTFHDRFFRDGRTIFVQQHECERQVEAIMAAAKENRIALCEAVKELKAAVLKVDIDREALSTQMARLEERLRER